eukprot:695352-Prorocentrum_lima.AAC.1
MSCFITSYDEEDVGEVEFYHPPVMAHWRSICPQELEANAQLVLTVNKQRASAVIKRELDNLSKEEILKHHKEVS